MSNQQTSSHEPEQEDLWRKEVGYNIRTLVEKVSSVFDLLNGAKMGTKNQKRGLVSMVEDHDDRLQKLEKFKFAATWFVRGTLIPASYGLWEIVRQFIAKH